MLRPLLDFPSTETITAESPRSTQLESSRAGRNRETGTLPLRWRNGRRFETCLVRLLESSPTGLVISMGGTPFLLKRQVVWVGQPGEWIESQPLFEASEDCGDPIQAFAFGLEAWRRAMIQKIESVESDQHSLRLCFKDDLAIP